MVNGYLDRETVSSYTLNIQAQDGGNPPNKGTVGPPENPRKWQKKINLIKIAGV